MKSQRVTVRDVTLREYGQNVPKEDLSRFSIDTRLWLAGELISSGFSTFEVASTASPKVAPAMSVELLRPFLHQLGRQDQVELITLVPSAGGYRRFLDLGLGPQDLGHTMGVFLSAMDEHNLANLRKTVAESLEELSRFVPEAIHSGVQVAGYVSAAFGFLPDQRSQLITVAPKKVTDLASRLADLGVSSVTLSDLQGVADPVKTADLLGELIHGPAPCPVPIGYHPHHTSIEPVLDNVESAIGAGVRLFDASLGAVGGCVTGAPGNAPTEDVVSRIHRLGFVTRLDEVVVKDMARAFGERL